MNRLEIIQIPRGVLHDVVSHRWAALYFICALLMVIYLPDVGLGFVKDDFVWISGSRVRKAEDVWALASKELGFYRPLVALSFAANELAFGLNARSYGVVNLALVIFIALLIVKLVVGMRLPESAGVLAAGLWSLNFHGINMAVLWISGRTALLLVACSLLAARAVLQDRRAAAAGWTLAALLSKEEAVALPVILFFWALFLRSEPISKSVNRLRLALSRTWLLFAMLPVYGVLRVNSGAITPSTAPPFYRFTFEPMTILENIGEYLDRSSTFAVAILLVMLVVVRAVGRLNDMEKRCVLSGCVWLIGGYALTVFLPVRSSLYACWPSVGTAIAIAAMASATWRVADARYKTRLIVGGIVLPLLLLPVYKVRNLRLKREAQLSTVVLREIGTVATGLADGDAIVVYDNRGQRPSIYSAFGGLLPEAVLLTTGKRLNAWLDPPPPDQPAVPRPDEREIRATFALRPDGFRRIFVVGGPSTSARN